MTHSLRTALIGVLAAVSLAAPAQAQRDPAYQAARQHGLVGEKPDGYLGFVSAPSDQLRALIDDLNLRRRSVYTERATTAGATVEQMAFTAGCNLIAQTVTGEKYMAPDRSWMTRTSEPPVRDSRCI